MTRENLLFAIIGILFGFIVGFMFASSMSQKQAVATVTPGASQSLPSDHPPVGAQNATGNPAGMRQEVSESIEQARKDPKNFDAQLKAGELFYQIQRYDQAIEFWGKANELKPNEYRPVILLGMANLDAGHFEVAEKWYRAALKIQQDDVVALHGVTAATLARGDAKAAEDAIAKLEKVDPSSEDLPRFKDQLANLKK
jgi:Flp pilus assembly protein TadD